jgi:putative sterol carrier protein
MPAHRPFTQPWADAFCAAVNADARYRTIAARWTWPVALVVEAEPTLGYDAAVAVRLELSGGHCAGARALAPEEADAPFVFRAPYAVWKRVVRGEVDPLAAVARGEIRLADGSLTTLLINAQSAKALVECARAVDTAFPDEPTPA